MKRLLALTLILILVFSISPVSQAFQDATANPYTGLIYTHDDKFDDSSLSYGVDLSVYQGSVNFSKLKNDGISFAILRAAYRGYKDSGPLAKDTKFASYASAAIDAGLDIGAYIYSQAITTQEAIEEANYILDIVSGYSLHLPIVFDYEYASGAPGGGRLYKAKLSAQKKTDICLAFCKQVESKGYTAMVYANHSMLVNDMYDEQIAKNYDIWLANFSTSPKLSGKMYDQDYTYWQYSSTGSVSGISGNVDMNFRYFKTPKDVANLRVTNENESSASLSWSKVKGCWGYRVYKLNKVTKQYKLVKTLSGAAKTSYTDSSTNGESHTYKVCAVSFYRNTAVLSDGATIVSKGAFYAKINSTTIDTTVLSWEEFEGASEYRVLYSDTPLGKFSEVATLEGKTTKATIKTTPSFRQRCFMVRAVVLNSSGKITKSCYSAILDIAEDNPVMKSATAVSGGAIKVSWKNTKYAKGTEVYRKLGSKGSWKRVKTLNNRNSSYTDNSVQGGKTYYYRIIQFVKNSAGGKVYSKVSEKEKKATTMQTPSLKLTTVSKTSVKLSYTSVKGANKYQIYMKQKGAEWKRIKTTSSLSFTKKGLKKNKTYYFKVRAYKTTSSGKFYTGYSNTKKKTTS